MPFAISDGGTGGWCIQYSSPDVCDIDRYLFSFIKQRHPGETLSKISEGRFLISRCFLKGIFVYANRGWAVLILAENIARIAYREFLSSQCLQIHDGINAYTAGDSLSSLLNSKWSVNLAINKYKRNWIKKTEKAYLYYPDDALEYYNVKTSLPTSRVPTIPEILQPVDFKRFERRPFETCSVRLVC